MKPLNHFETKQEAIEYYTENSIMMYDDAVDFVEKNWETTRGD